MRRADACEKFYVRSFEQFAGIMNFVGEGQCLTVDIVTGAIKNLDTGAGMQAEAWREGTPPYEILMAGGLDAYMKIKLKERGLVS